MQVAAPQLAAHLQRGLKPLYTLYGDEALLQQEAQDAIRQHARARGYTERTVFTVAGAYYNWSAVFAAGNSLSLFADRQIVEVRIPSGKPGKEGSAALQRLAQEAANNDSTLTLVILPHCDRTTRESAWFVALEQHGVVVPIVAVARSALPAWIAQRLAAQGQRVAPGEEGQRSLQLFADRVEGNLLAAHQEVMKLALAFPPEQYPQLSLEQIDAAVRDVARFEVFQLSEAVLAGQTLRVQRMLEGLQAEGESEVLVHWVLAEDIRALKRTKDAMAQGKPLPMALQEQRIWAPRDRLFERVLGRLPAAVLATLLQGAYQVDGVVKGLRHPDWPQQPWAALHRLAQSLTQACRSAANH